MNCTIDITISPVILKTYIRDIPCKLVNKYIHIHCGGKIKVSNYINGDKRYQLQSREIIKEICRDNLSNIVMYIETTAEVAEFDVVSPDKIVLYREWQLNDSIIREYKPCTYRNVWEIKKDCFDVDPSHICDSNMNQCVITHTCHRDDAEMFINKWVKLDPEFAEYVRQKLTLQPILQLSGAKCFDKLFGINSICGLDDWITITQHKHKYKYRDYIPGRRCIINVKTGDVVTDTETIHMFDSGGIFRVYAGVIQADNTVYAHSRIGKRSIRAISTRDGALLKICGVVPIYSHSLDTLDGRDRPLSFTCGLRSYHYMPQRDITVCFRVMSVPVTLVGISPFTQSAAILLCKYDANARKLSIPRGICPPRGYVPFIIGNKYTYLYTTGAGKSGKTLRFKWCKTYWKPHSPASVADSYTDALRLFRLSNESFSIMEPIKKTNRRINIRQAVLIPESARILTDGIYIEGSLITSIDNVYPHIRETIRGPLTKVKSDTKFDIILYYGFVTLKWVRAAIKLLNPFGQIHLLTQRINVNVLSNVTIYDRKKMDNGYELISCVRQ